MMNNNFHTNCLICNSKNIISMKDYTKSYLIKCADCKFVFSKKIPTETELSEHYNQYKRNKYLSPLTIKRYNELLDKFEKYRDLNRILDVGCGSGYFLEVAKKRGWDVYGTEYTDEAIKICIDKDINMYEGKLNPENFDIHFDIITSFEVLEHINNPVEEINNFNLLLRQNGLVYITTPNFNSLLRYKLKEKYNVICYPEHLSYYTPKTLDKLLKSCGFNTLKILSTGISLTRFKTSSGKSKQALISKDSDDEKIRNKFESNKLLSLLKYSINKVLTMLGIGDGLKGFFVKL